MIKLNREDLENKIRAVIFTKLGDKTTVCCLVLNSGFEVTGISTTINPEEFDELVGETLAYEKAIMKILELEVYHQSESAYAKIFDEPTFRGDCGCDCDDCGCEAGFKEAEV